jgi:hypothetical protein
VVPAVLEIAQRDSTDIEPRVLALSLRVPFDGMIDAHSGIADTRSGELAAIETAPIETTPIEGPKPVQPEAQP